MITCTNPEKNLGTIKAGVLTKFEYEVINTSDTETYKELSGRASCGCTAPKLEKHTLLPGEKMKVFVTFDSMGKKGNTTKSVYIEYKNHNEIMRCSMKFNATIIE